MNKKGFFQKLMGKVGTGILFIAACFAAVFILLEFHGNYVFVGVAAILLMITGYLFLNALFEEKAKEWSKLPEEDEQETPSVGDGESKLRETKYLKEIVGLLTKQNEILTEQIENLEHEIYMLSEKQIEQTKTLIKYNKENARQMAISERETLEHVMLELKKAMEHAPSGVVYEEPENVSLDIPDTPVAVMEETAVAAEETFTMDEIPEAELFTMPEELMGEEAEPEIPDIPDMEEIPEIPDIADIPGLEEIPEIPDIADIPGLEEIPEMPDIADIPGLEEIPEIPDIADIPGLEEIPEMPDIADIPDLEVIPEMPDIADIPGLEEIPEIPDIPDLPDLEEISEVQEPVKEETPLPSFSSDPNAMMTPDEIAKLLEAMGN